MIEALSRTASFSLYQPFTFAYRFQYRAPDRTLKAEEVDTAHLKVLEALTQKLGVKFR